MGIEEITATDWPRQGDKLFVTSHPDWRFNARLTSPFTSSASWWNFLEGFRDGAEAAVEQLVHGRFQVDSLVYPIVFGYRHHFELVLKSIIVMGSDLLDWGTPYPGHHELTPLWRDARRVLQARWNTEDPTPVDRAEAVILELAKVDPRSFIFRYPVDNQGKPISPPLTMFNVVHFTEVARRTSAFLVSCATGLDAELGIKKDWLAEMKREAEQWASW